MATREQREQAEEAILAALIVNAKYSAQNVGTAWSAAVVQLAEAYAWVAAPGQPHGGSSVPPKSS